MTDRHSEQTREHQDAEKPSGISFSDAVGSGEKREPSPTRAAAQNDQQHEKSGAHIQRTPYQEPIVYPALDAVALRTGYYGVTGRLFVSMDQIRSTLASAGPVGEAAVERMDALSKVGWKFGPQSVNDPYLMETVPNRAMRSLRAVLLGGYNDAVHGKIAYNQVNSALYTALGMSPGADKDAAVKMAHELSHYDKGYFRAYEHDQQAQTLAKRLGTADPPTRIDLQARGIPDSVSTDATTVAREELREEMRALGSQQYVARRLEGPLSKVFPQSFGVNNLAVETSWRADSTGGYTKAWPYEGLKNITTREAVREGQIYNREAFAGGVFKDGKLNLAGEQAAAERIRSLPNEAPLKPIPTLATAESDGGAMARFFANPENRQFLLRGGQAVGAVGTVLMLSDLGGAFKYSPGTGLGRTADMATNLAGFEIGTAIGANIGTAVAETVSRRIPVIGPVAVPLATLLSGVVGAQIAHNAVGEQLSTKIQKLVDGK